MKTKNKVMLILAIILIVFAIVFIVFHGMKGKHVMKNGYNLSGRPDYSESKLEIPIGAYCGPRKAGIEYMDGEETVPHNVSYVTDEGFQDFVDAGLSYVFAEYDAN